MNIASICIRIAWLVLYGNPTKKELLTLVDSLVAEIDKFFGWKFMEITLYTFFPEVPQFPDNLVETLKDLGFWIYQTARHTPWLANMSNADLGRFSVTFGNNKVVVSLFTTDYKHKEVQEFLSPLDKEFDVILNIYIEKEK